MTDPAEWLTIAEAAARLGVGERRLRRLLDRPQFAGRAQTVTRQTKTGTRQAVTVPAALLPEIAQGFEIGENAANGDNNRDSDNGDTPEEPKPKRGGGTLTLTEQRLSERLAEEQRKNDRLEARVDELVSIIGTLTRNAAAVNVAPPALTETPPEPLRMGWMQGLWAKLRGRQSD